MQLRVRQAERAAKHVADFVVQAHGRGFERVAGQPGPVECFGPGVDVRWVLGYPGQCQRQCANALLRHERDDGVAIHRIQSFDAVRNRVHSTRRGEGGRKRKGQCRVVHDALGANMRIAPGDLLPVFRDPVDRRHLGSRVACRNRHDRYSQRQRNGLAQADGGTAADGHAAVRLESYCELPGFHGGFDRNMHGSVVTNTGEEFTEVCSDPSRDVSMRGRREDQYPSGAQHLHFFRDLGNAAHAEDRSPAVAGKGERPDHSATRSSFRGFVVRTWSRRVRSGMKSARARSSLPGSGMRAASK